MLFLNGFAVKALPVLVYTELKLMAADLELFLDRVTLGQGFSPGTSV
jgi:hypothetical protein